MGAITLILHPYYEANFSYWANLDIIMSICPSCNSVNPDDYQFCQFCGSKIVTEVVNQPLGDSAIAAPLSVESAVTTAINLEHTEHIQDGEIGDARMDSEAHQPPELLDHPDIENEARGNASEEAQEDIDNAIAVTIPIMFPEIATTEPTASIDLGAMPDASLDLPSATEQPDFPQVHLSQVHLQDIVYAGKTDVGRQRNRNEDDFVTIFQTRSSHGKSQISDRSQRGLFVLCDGMGGHEGGAEASAIAVKSITEQFLPFWVDTLPGEKKLNEIIGNANQAIFDRNEEGNRQSLGRMGTTLVMLAIHDLDVVIAHVGDSRIYKVTNSPNDSKNDSETSTEDLENPLAVSATASSAKLAQITRDHDVLNQLLDLGMDRESSIARPDSHQLTQALGPNPSDRLEPSIQFFTLTEPTLFLLCSDGLCDNDVIEENWQTHLLPILNKEIDLATGLDNLIDLGNNMNGHDNITGILVMCEL
ncbi:protein phosphatase 2C domain-containing protein [Pseudanabaena sp. ABRG5-3]|uniref:protein phosphatase 2C domain-containing protein n=1 Tax=Pseudanabaena sp. ABRG5-3 TaxID=685565 RepID=UPI000DC74142|nr:protein phosphatase 2C domain-containing protein [Pseudanabaena sp. ABRG5-3]BBC23137.1 protein serine/threonine phosphatase [Pseudanabaena sp. ABRG5-3]